MKHMLEEAVSLFLVCRGNVRFIYSVSDGKTAFPVTASVSHEEY